jgi:hypothetical protein
MLTRRRFRSIDDWLAFCRYEPRGQTDAAGLSEAERVDAIQRVSQLLAAVLLTYEDAAPLVNLWLAKYASSHRLFPVVGKRTRQEGAP